VDETPVRILLVADIHANWAALRSVAAEPHDICLCLGDLVEYGVEPLPCVNWVREHSRYCVRGNHDHGAAQNVTVNSKAGYRFLTAATRVLTRQLLNEDSLRYLARLPVSRTVTVGETRFLLVHASPRDPLDEYAPADAEYWARRLEHVEADVICVGHTHQPYVLQVGDKLVVNPGSVGQPRDGDPRASCAVIEDNTVDFKRVEYPIEETVTAVQAAALPQVAKDFLVEVLRTGNTPIGGSGSRNGNGA
jgi:putative phosphoesterase